MARLESSLGKARGLGSAKDGTQHWWLQRITAVALVPLTVWFTAGLIAMTGQPYEAVIAWLQQPWTAILMLLFVLVGIYHLRLGVQVVIEDYVEGEFTKVASLMLLTMICVLAVAAGSFAILRIAFA